MSSTSDLLWYDRTFAELSATQLYAIAALRERVFIVEQACAYQELDGLDFVSRHLWAERDGRILAYLRLIPAGARYPEPSIGRVVTAPEARGSGLGRTLMLRGLSLAGASPLRISAQAYLERFYLDLGFVRSPDNPDLYDEDGIPHVEMIRPAPAAA